MVVLRILPVLLLLGVVLAGCLGDDTPEAADPSTGTGNDSDAGNSTAPSINESGEEFFNNTAEITKDPPPPVPEFNEIGTERVSFQVVADGGVTHLPILATDTFRASGIGFTTPGNTPTGEWAIVLVPRGESLHPAGGSKCNDVSETLRTYVRGADGSTTFSWGEIPAGEYDMYVHGKTPDVNAYLRFNEPQGPVEETLAGERPDPIEPNQRTVQYNVTYLDTQIKEQNGDGTHYTAGMDVPGARSGLFVAGFRTSSTYWTDSMEATTSLAEVDNDPCYSDEVSGSPEFGNIGRSNVVFYPDIVIMPGNDLTWTAESKYGGTFSANGNAAAALFNFNGDVEYGPFWLDRGDT